MPTWVAVLLISGAVPVIITGGVRLLSVHWKSRVSDAEVGQALRDELRGELDRLKTELADMRTREQDCEERSERQQREIGQLRADLTELQHRVRQGSSGPEQVRRDYLEEASGA